VERDSSLIDGVRLPFGSYGPWIKPLAVYLRHVTGNGTLIEPEADGAPDRSRLPTVAAGWQW
jgi:hypothetical protein